jgi:hypothetical protein
MKIKQHFKYGTLLFIVIFNLINFNGYGQFYYGSTKQETIKKISLDDPEALLVLDSLNFLEYKMPSMDARLKIFYNEKNIAFMNVLAPFSQVSLNKWIKTFNNNCIVKSDTEWVSYSMGYVFNYYLLFKEDLYFFAITNKPNNEK